MKFFIDTANIDHIREANAWGVICGVTTNPSLIAKEGRDFVETIHEICTIVDGPVSAEVVATTADEMVRQGKLLAKIHDNVVVKVPLSEVGITACSQLSRAGIRVNVTLCFNASQALLAARAGATYISPFVGRVDDIAWEGVELVEQIASLYASASDIDTQVLAASVRHPLHVVQVALAGADVATVPYAVLKKMFLHPLTDIGNAAFNKDWEGVADRDIAGQVERWLSRRG